MKDPVASAERMKATYHDYFIGRGGRAARSVANRLADGEDDITGMRGPYLQALDIPNWSEQSWDEFARSERLEPHVRRAFSKIGFERLYDFQERSIEAILEGDDTVITAATGRGKTEAWLIPILNRILEAKRYEEQSDETSVKATLIYPTKALAQDQLKRLLQYLYLINKELKSDQQISVGIYDGDTPRDMSESGAEGYLNATFRHFECPGYNPELEKCQDCGAGVRIRNTGARFKLIPEKAGCESDSPNDVPLDFLRLTKHNIRQEGVDILLTNPDTINYRLINTNAEDEHERFIYEPEFIVFDEVHTYDGLFGSYTSMLMKRVQALRENRDVGDLQLIASSATVDNDVELFQKVSGAVDVTQISESPRELDETIPSSVPDVLISEQLSVDRILHATSDPDDSVPGLESFDYMLEDAETYDRDRRETLVSDALFDYLTRDDDEEGVQVIQYIYQLLYEEPLTKAELHQQVAETLDIGDAETERLVSNVRILGEFSGVLENRAHVFSWPIDGFYACPSCDAVYRSPQDTCRECEFEFITRSTYCRHCSDEHLIAWYCPDCDQMEPYTPSEYGSVNQVEDEHVCRRCETARDQLVQMIRVTFQPHLQCQDCNHLQERTTTRECQKCGSRTVRTGNQAFTCINPTCELVHRPDRTCDRCGSSTLDIAVASGRFDCVECGITHDNVESELDHCTECDSSLTSTRYLPFVCKNDNCTRLHFEEDLGQCGCGKSLFVKRGLFEISDDTHCRSCSTGFVGGGGCGCDDPDHHQRSGGHRAYKTIDPQGRIHTLSSRTEAVPCPHQYARYEVGSRFDELMRSPNNLAATTSQYLLRSIADEEGQKAAKLLSFADSHREMKELSRDFSEPEVETLLDQLLIGEASSEENTTWKSFNTIIREAEKTVEQLNELLEPPRVSRTVEFDLKSRLKNQPRKRWDDGDAFRDRLTRRALPHTFSQRLGEREGALSEVGLLDIRFGPGIEDLSSDERSIIRELIEEGNGYRVENFTNPSPDRLPTDVVAELVDRDILSYGNSEDYVSFSPAALEVTIAGKNDDIQFDPQDEQYYTTLHQQFGLNTSTAVSSNASFAERASPSHPRFTQRAHRVEFSQTRILISEEYLGTTEKRKRRELEFLFREENYPHHLSSGPTMELGVDIGALDALLLYGSPPNMNAYLQRVGRAGRTSHSSLVHSVSQRNPIDYYYYDHPDELINTDPTPVPLNEHNEEVLRVSLSWAIFDYVASNFSIPWDVKKHGRTHSIEGGDTYHRLKSRTGTEKEETSKLTHVMSLSADTLSLSNTDSYLNVLSEVVSDHKPGITDYLESLLDYQYCEACERRYSANEEIGSCGRDDCDGKVRYARNQFEHLIQDVIKRFDERYITNYRIYKHSLEDEVADLRQRNRKLRRKQQRASADERGRIMAERSGLEERIDVLEDHLSNIGAASYFDFLTESRESKFDFSMRSVATTAGLTLVDEGYERRNVGSQESGRAMQMALSELHPGAAYLDGGETYTVSRVRLDQKAGSDLRKIVSGDMDSEKSADELVCPSCHTTHNLNAEGCECDNDVPLKRRRLAVLDSVDAYHDNLQLTSEGDEARHLHNKPNQEVQNTYAERQTSILSFDSDRTFELRTSNGRRIGTLKYGNYSVLIHTESYQTKYKSGEVDPRETLFEVCGEENCSGVIYRDNNEERRCSADPDHFPDGRGADSEFIKLGYCYDTQGVRVDLADRELSHTLAHGLRVALQYLGGVNIRELAEYVGEDCVDVFESQEGGSDVVGLLFERTNGEYRSFGRAIDLIQDQFDCDCENGCPSCLYQYGCDVRNDQRSFDRSSLSDLLQDSGLSLRAVDESGVEEQIEN